MLKKPGLVAGLFILAILFFGCGSAPLGNANLTGTVVDATSNEALSGAKVCLLIDGREAVCNLTNGEGTFFLNGLPDGPQTIRASATGYITYDQQVELVEDETVSLVFASSPGLNEGDWRIVLSWEEYPEDLDSHLWVPIFGGYDEIYYSSQGNCMGSPWACLDVDDTTSYGPETITITELANEKYAFAVHWFGGSGSWARSGAVARIYNADGLVREFSAPANSTSAVKSWWYVFDFDNGNIVPHNIIQNTPPLTSSASLQTK